MPSPDRSSSAERYVPAAGRAWLTRVYDPVMALTMRERAFRPALVSAVLSDGRPRVVVDVGCGTGTLITQLAAADRSLRIIGVDGDQQVLARAREKAAAADAATIGDRVEFRKGLADKLPFDDGSVDAVVMSLLLHHLAPDAKLRALREAHRVSRPEGRLIVADWGRPRDPLTRAGFFALQVIDGFANTRDHAAGRLPDLITQAGFSAASVEQRWRTVWGSLELIIAGKDRRRAGSRG
jgi:ubiquinone/menaquinone biosynthesis C-methylase UbiE